MAVNLFRELINLSTWKKRNTEKYIVQHCNKERLKRSAIPHMQRLLKQLEEA